MKKAMLYPDRFLERHIVPRPGDLPAMLEALGVSSLEELAGQTIPGAIRLNTLPDLPEPASEMQLLEALRQIASRNKLYRSYIGLGYYGTITPPVIQRNILENPGWYTQYTPYQAEISQGRLEALLIYQTVISELTGLPLANASLLDEATAAAEAMLMLYRAAARSRQQDKKVFLVDKDCFPQTRAVLETRAGSAGITLQAFDKQNPDFPETAFGLFLQNPDQYGKVNDLTAVIAIAHEKGLKIAVATDLMASLLIRSAGQMGADIAVGSAQRFGVPLFYGGPHAGFFATTEEFKRLTPGRIIGISVDAENRPALRMALQTREQHIRREKATSNICTAQALLAIVSGMYAVYHGPERLYRIAGYIHHMACTLSQSLEKLGFDQLNNRYFDTIRVKTGRLTEAVHREAVQRKINFHYPGDETTVIALDETVTQQDLLDIVSVFAPAAGKKVPQELPDGEECLSASLLRKPDYLQEEVFQRYHSETEMMRFLKRLENKDLSLVHAMTPLGSCTMKLNAAVELLPVTWPEFAKLHPFVPLEQAEGYQQLIRELEDYLCRITGFSACSLQPNAGAQGEFTGLMVIRAFHHDNGQPQRNVVLIPASAHGTNPASAVMAGMQVVVVACDEGGNTDLADLKQKAEEYSDRLAALMITYPSTHGIFEEDIVSICDTVHTYGGLVYMDGANMNAQAGLTSPVMIHADVCHLNLHKTFAIPHGGGGPGVGPICVNEKLAPYLPGHPLVPTGGSRAISAVSAAPFGSPGILPVSWAYIRLLGSEGLKQASLVAILNANYIKSKLEGHYPVLYTGSRGRVAHELIVDVRPIKQKTGIDAVDIAKRLIDYGFHAPTVSFPVHDTLMIEPTESESREELDRFCEAMIHIREEIREVEEGKADTANNLLKNAPHTATMLAGDWPFPYSREKAVFPQPYLKERKFWPPVARVNNPYGDRNLVCIYPPVESFAELVN